MFEHIFRIVIAKISILTLNRINATEPKLKIEDYNSMKEKLSNRLNQLKSKQQIKETGKSEFEEYLFKGVGLLKNFGSAYENYDLDGKHQLLGSTFPEKIIFDGKKCRTTKMNEAFSLIVSVDKGLKKGKKNKSIKRPTCSLLWALLDSNQ